MMRRMVLGIVAVLALLGVVACDGLPRPDDTRAEDAVGQLVVAWDQADDESITTYDGENRLLITSEDEWEAWTDALPAALVEHRSAEIDAVSLDDSVLVIGVWHRCTEYSHVVRADEGVVEFHVHNPEPGVACAWSPMQLEVWRVPLEDLGVDDPSEVTLGAEG